MSVNTQRVVVHVWWNETFKQIYTHQDIGCYPLAPGYLYLGSMQADMLIPCPTKAQVISNFELKNKPKPVVYREGIDHPNVVGVGSFKVDAPRPKPLRDPAKFEAVSAAIQKASKNSNLFKQPIYETKKTQNIWNLRKIANSLKSIFVISYPLVLTFNTIDHTFEYHSGMDRWYQVGVLSENYGKTTQEMIDLGWVYDADKNPDHWTCI